jgi:hypothetical protein
MISESPTDTMIQSAIEEGFKTKTIRFDTFVKNTEAQITTLKAKVVDLTGTVSNAHQVVKGNPERPIKLVTPTFTTVTASSSESIELFFGDLNLQMQIHKMEQDVTKCAFFQSTLSNKTDAATLSMVATVRTAVNTHAVEVPAGESSFAHIAYPVLVKAVKQAFSRTDTKAEKANAFLGYEVMLRATFPEAARDFFNAVRNSFSTDSHSNPSSVELIRTKMLSSFESKFPKTVEQFQLRQGLLESTAASTDETPTWTLDTLETVFRESNDSSKEAICRPRRNKQISLFFVRGLGPLSERLPEEG